MKTVSALFFSCIGLMSYGQVLQTANKNPEPIRVSGDVSLMLNGVSPVPAFSLTEPVLSAFLNIRKGRFSYHPSLAFIWDGTPWYFNNHFRYQVITESKFTYDQGVIWGVGYTYPQVALNGKLLEIARAERYFHFELLPKYRFTERFSISSTTYISWGLDEKALRQMRYISLIANFDKIPITTDIYWSAFPQIFYLNLDGSSDGYFTSELFGIGTHHHHLFLAGQFSQTLVTNLSPKPGFLWSVNLTWSF